MEIEPEMKAKLPPEVKNTPSLLESYYRFNPDYDRLIGLSHAKIFFNLM